MNKRPIYIQLLSLLAIGSCQKPPTIEAPTKLSPYLSQIVETRFTPKDSISITFLYDREGRLTEEQVNIQPARRPYSVFTIYNESELASYKNYNDQYRLNSLTKNQQLVSSKKYLAQSGSYWQVFESDTMMYKQNLLVGQEHRDYYFTADSQENASRFPLWLTKRAYRYDSHNRISTEVDSVFVTHDFPTGKNYFEQTPAAYKFTNRSSYEYNEKNEISKKTTISGAKYYPSLTFSNGWSIYDQFGVAWSTYFYSWPGRFLDGVTTYSYEYQADGKISKKTARFEDAQTKQVYTSLTTYFYQP